MAMSLEFNDLSCIFSECRTFPPPPPGHVPPYEKWHMRTSAPQAIDIGGHVPPTEKRCRTFAP